MDNLNMSKRNIIVLIMSLVLICGMVLPFMEGVTLLDMIQRDDSEAVMIKVFMIAFWVCLAATNLFLFVDRYDFSKLSSIISLVALLIAVFACFGKYGRIDGGFFLDNLISGCTLYLVLAVTVVVLCCKGEKT